MDKKEETNRLLDISDFNVRPYKFKTRLEKNEEDELQISRPRRRSIDALQSEHFLDTSKDLFGLK